MVVTQNPLHLADRSVAVRRGTRRRAMFQPLADLLGELSGIRSVLPVLGGRIVHDAGVLTAVTADRAHGHRHA
ncbi:MAG TPA: hypothetical protein VFW66_10375 [Gemmatimonadales bacterium]|nr:hypothetical protein [Gemmatimonadales bacterium]